MNDDGRRYWKFGKRELTVAINSAKESEDVAKDKLIASAQRWVDADASNSQQVQRRALSDLYDTIIAHKIADKALADLKLLYVRKGYAKKRGGKKR